MEKRCYICGVVGFEELIATCMECKSSFIHLYCMKTVLLIIPDDWICENCQESPKQGKRHHPSPEKACKTVEVPIKGVKNPTKMVPLATSPTRCDVHVCSPEKPSGLPSAENKLQNSRKNHSVHAHKPSAVPEPSSKQKSCIKYPVHAHTPSSISKPSLDVQSFKELFIPAQTTSKKSRRGFSQGGYPCKDTLKASKNAREQMLSVGKLTMDRYLPNHPASNATWKGCFRTSGFAAPVRSCDTVWGYPPAKVRKKAYEFSKKMPDVLHFEAISRCTVWENMFNDGGPDKDDIGLYFFPIGDKSEECYFCLVSDLEEQDIVLKSSICGIELLIFSSSCLDEKSKEINNAYYLWGLFLPPVITIKEPDQNQLPAKINTEPAFQHIPKNEQDVDMEIDMLGGAPVGKIEVPVPRDSLLSSLKTSKAASQPVSVVQVKPEKWSGVVLASPPGFPALQVEPRVPPGFEETGRVKYKTIDEILQSRNGR